MDRRRFVALAATAPFALRAAAARAAAAPHALVTCDAEARLALVDLDALTVVRSIPVPPDPRSIERVGEVALVCHTAVGRLSVVDTRGVRRLIDGFVEPRYTAAHPDGRLAFVTDSGHSSVTAVDVVRGAAVGRVRLPGWARHVSLDPKGRVLWVGLGSASATVAVVDVSNPARPRHVATVRPPFRAHDVVWAPEGGQVWVTSGADAAAAIYDPAGRLLVHVAADLAPQHVTFGHRVAFVTSGDSGTLRVHRLRDGALVAETAVETGSYNVQYGLGRVLTPSLTHGTLTVLDGRGRRLGAVRVAASCHDACLAA